MVAFAFDIMAKLRKPIDPVVWVGLLCFVATAMLSACHDEPRSVATLEPPAAATATPRPTASPTPEPTASPTPEPTASPTPEPTATPTPEPLTSVQIFEKVAPAIALIETATGIGSGVLIEGGYVVTNAHVVWPYNTIRVVFPDGSEFDGVQVKGWDLLADWAVLGPIDAVTDGLALVDKESLPIGTDMFLIGYPGETEEFPQPTIVRGLLSRVREGESTGITYLQTDAPAIGGQSGGALVSDMGEVVGIIGLAFAEGYFAIAASSADVLPRVRQIIAGEDPSGLGDRRVPLEGGDLRHEVELANYWAERAYVVNEPSGTVTALELTGDNDGALTVYDSFGTELLYLDNADTGTESGSFVIEYDEPYFLIAWQLSETPGDFTLTANRRLIPLHDPDDGRQIQVGQPILGNIDFPGDIDYYFVHLIEGETIEIVARSTLADTFLTIDYLGAADEQIIIDDDSGGGLFGRDSMIVYRAPHTGKYFVVVDDPDLYAPGGYVITIAPAGPGAITTPTTRASLTRASMLGDSDTASTAAPISLRDLTKLTGSTRVRLNLWLPSLTAREPAARPMLPIRPAPMPAMSRSWRV